MAKIVFINPRFTTSFWSFTHALPMLNRKAVIPTAALALLAALTPDQHEVSLIDETVEPIDFDEVAKADIVAMTGMVVQRERMREIAKKVKDLGKFLVVGGPWITVQEDYLQGLADVIFVGEADHSWPLFLHEWAEGKHRSRYEQTERTDMTTLPAPRIDLIKTKRYLQGSVQISRGCPYLCEFCDIIVTFGRQPRIKTADQVIREIDDWYRAGVWVLFLADDNIIGNRKAVIPILTRIAEWQQKHNFIMSLHTEASLNLADDEELLDLFVKANIRSVFVGIESPNPASLLETKKFQNVNRREQQAQLSNPEAESFLLERIYKIQNKGMRVTCGLILGFDADTPDIFDVHRQFVRQSGVIQAMVGLLGAIPKTPLYERLKSVGRLDEQNVAKYGTNVVPLGMSREQLTQGYVSLLQEFFEPDAFFDRLDDLYIRRRFYLSADAIRLPLIPFWVQVKFLGLSLTFAMIMLIKLLWYVDTWALRQHYCKRLLNFIKHRPQPMRIFEYILESVCHYHFYRFSQDMVKGETGIISTMDGA